MKWYSKLLLSLFSAIAILGIVLIIYAIWFKYERNDYVDSISMKFAVAAETSGLKATSEGVTTEISPMNYNTVLFYLTRDPAFTMKHPSKNAACIDLLLGETEHIRVYSTDDPQIGLVYADVNGKKRWHRLTYTNLFQQLSLTVSEKGFHEPNQVLSYAP